MARPAISFEFPDIPGLADKFRALPASLASAALGTAVKKALQPAQEKLKQITPVGPTGNLKRGIATKAKRYPKTKTAVAIVGYRKPNSSKPPKSGTKRRNRQADKTQHQLLVEYGSKQRFTKAGAYRGIMPGNGTYPKGVEGHRKPGKGQPRKRNDEGVRERSEAIAQVSGRSSCQRTRPLNCKDHRPPV
jgi:hypothetical protein